MFLLGLLLTVILVASKEYVHILRMKGFHPSFSVMGAVGILLCFIIAINRLALIPAVLVLGTIASFLIVLFMGRQPYIANVATTELGFVYGALLPCHIMLIRQIEIDITSKNILIYEPSEGFFLTMFVFLCILVTDTAAYFFGSRYGKHKLSSVISPKTTIEGALYGGFEKTFCFFLGVFLNKLMFFYCCLVRVFIMGHGQFGR